MFDGKGRYVIENYQKKPPFSSFLPGIAGPLGVPVWCYYNNRGQGVCSFGVDDKDHAIMEFSPARTAYRNVSRTGFRTFCKANGTYRELFTQDCSMHIGMSELEIACRDGELEAGALYFGVPGERTAALARVLTVRNTGAAPVELELLDGMPELVPYGVDAARLAPGETLNVFSLYGQAEHKGRVAALAERVGGGARFEAKRREAARLVEELCAPIETRTGDPVFDAYCKQTYLDNLLRGGAPVFFADGGKKAPFYLYSRKHGDPEREYNYFSLGGEYYAQGNGNFRDVNQNRRCDVLFAPDVGAKSTAARGGHCCQGPSPPARWPWRWRTGAWTPGGLPPPPYVPRTVSPTPNSKRATGATTGPTTWT